MNGYEDLRQIKTRIQAVTNILLHESSGKLLHSMKIDLATQKTVFCKKKYRVFQYILSKLCINICDLSIKGLAWILCSHDSLVKRQLQ